jgi:hypothetical protein
VLQKSLLSPPAPLPSVALLTALGFLQDLRAGDAVADMAELAENADVMLDALMPLIDRAEADGYLTIDDDGALRLTLRGWRWYETHHSG